MKKLKLLSALSVWVIHFFVGGTVAKASSAMNCNDIAAAAAEHKIYTNAELLEAFHSMSKYLNYELKGMPKVIELVTMTMLVNGHVLLEGPPGVGKTSLANELAKATGGKSSRIQFTADLMPGDITGSMEFNHATGGREFDRGPIFADVVLADEINRATPKTQSALLEAMQEGRVTIKGVSHHLPEDFFVIATENPFDGTGTYPLPDAQIDRFMMRIDLGLPDFQVEKEILAKHLGQQQRFSEVPLRPLTQEQKKQAKLAVKTVLVSEKMMDAIITIVVGTRKVMPELLPFVEGIDEGASSRAPQAIASLARAHAWLHGRNAIDVSDIRAVAVNALIHRVKLKPTTQLELGGGSSQAIISNLVEQVFKLLKL